MRLTLLLLLCVAVLFNKSSAASQGQRIAALEIAVARQAEQIAELTEKLANRGNSKKTEVSIVSGEEGLGDSSCAKVCAGTTRRFFTQWEDYSSDGISTTVDMSDCGFVKTPTIITDLEGFGWQWKTTSAIYSATPDSFRLQVRNWLWDPQGGNAGKKGWNVEWIAVGYTC